jgi:hypothetical protein
MESAKKEEMANGEPASDPIAVLSFRVAKTMPEIPHEYVVRTPENNHHRHTATATSDFLN